MTANDDELALDPVALAIEDRFLEEWRAGKRPRLSVYARRYPEHAAALADLAASLPLDAQADATYDAVEMALGAFPAPLWNGAGAQRALGAIFGASATTTTTASDADQLSHVAEERAPYGAERADDSSADDTD